MKTALDAALSYLSRRILTRYEMEQRLRQKGFSEEEVYSALERVIEWGYLNDQEYAFSYTRTKQVTYSKKRIEMELKRRGITDQIIEETLREIYSPLEEKELCTRQAQKMWTEELRRWENSYQYKKSYAKIPRDVFLKQRIGQKLLQKGHPLDLIYQVLEEFRVGRD